MYQIYIQATANNTLLTCTDASGNAKFTVSAGSVGFKNSRKSTPYASQTAAEELAKKCLGVGIREVHVRLKGLGFGKEAALRGLQTTGLFIRSLEECTPISHNGCRIRKKRRL